MFTGKNGSERLENFETKLKVGDENICFSNWNDSIKQIEFEETGVGEYPSVSKNFPGSKRDNDLPIDYYWAKDAFKDQSPIDWILKDCFSASSVSVAYGHPGSKKTYSMMDCALCVALGKPWLGFTTKQSTVLIIDEESGPRRLKERIRNAIRGHSAPEDLPLVCTALARFDFQQEKYFLKLDRLIKKFDAKLVIIDAFVDIMPGGDENSSQHVQPIFRGFRYIAEENQVAILSIHHANRNGGIRGSSAITGAVDLQMKITAPRNSNTINFEAEKTRDVEAFKFSAIAHIQDDKVWLSNGGEAESDKQLTDAQMVVIEYLATNLSSSVDDIHQKNKVYKKATFRAELNNLRKLKITERVDFEGNGKKGIWDLTIKGKQLARDEGFFDDSSEEPPW